MYEFPDLTALDGIAPIVVYFLLISFTFKAILGLQKIKEIVQSSHILPVSLTQFPPLLILV